MLHLILSRLTVFGGCILLFAGMMVCCSPSQKQKEQTISVVEIPVIDTIQKVVNVDTSFHDIAYKVLKAKGVLKTKEYINNQIVFDTREFRYTVWSTHPNSYIPVFSVWRRPLGTTSKDIDTWCVDIKTGKIRFFINPKGEAFFDGKYYHADSEAPLDIDRVKSLQQYFNVAQADVVKEIIKRF